MVFPWWLERQARMRTTLDGILRQEQRRGNQRASVFFVGVCLTASAGRDGETCCGRGRMRSLPRTWQILMQAERVHDEIEIGLMTLCYDRFDGRRQRCRDVATWLVGVVDVA